MPEPDQTKPPKHLEGPFGKALTALVFAETLTITVLLSTYITTWLGEFEYNAQIAKHVVVLFWVTMVGWTYNFPGIFMSFWRYPDEEAYSHFIIGLVYVFSGCILFSDSILDLLYRGNIGATYTVQGTRTLPRLDPAALFKAAISIYSCITATGIFFWGWASFKLVGGNAAPAAS
ncbi:hypothetical protein H4R18_000641 [Coemansia javaensis]|uniref:Uncharacterized protein n=1 Tax=Coemansia javaensis TaxID=2761396 RepID=A0A9W8HHJ0_9FUNG|nr:hypothetical protein H4R18_000641 [Coemansia javaensis]